MMPNPLMQGALGGGTPRQMRQANVQAKSTAQTPDKKT